MILDDWQKEILETKGNILLCSGRQVGKSTIIAARDGERAARNNKESILIISATERQAEELFIKVLNYLEENYRHLIRAGKFRPTKHTIQLKNGSIIRCLPTGMAGTGIRGFTITKLTADEAAFIPNDVWGAVTPMLLTTCGTMDLLSTPHGKGEDNYFYKSYKNENGDFKVFHINSEEVITNRKISPSWTVQQREGALMHLEKEKRRMSKLEYAQEYMGEFTEKLRQFFSDEIIKKCWILKRTAEINSGKNYLGVDIARMGEDESTFEVISEDNNRYRQIENEITTKTLTTETEKKILELMEKFNIKKIGLDAGAGTLGVSILDHLLETKARNKVIALNNRAMSMDPDGKKKQKLFKEDLYNNMLGMMERGELKLLDDDEVLLSLKSIQFEYVTTPNKLTKLRIFGSYSHVAEGLIRACWVAKKEKTLNLWAY